MIAVVPFCPIPLFTFSAAALFFFFLTHLASLFLPLLLLRNRIVFRSVSSGRWNDQQRRAGDRPTDGRTGERKRRGEREQEATMATEGNG